MINIENTLQIHYRSAIAVVIGGLASYYLLMIYCLPGFITDDYYIFYLIDQNAHSLYVSNPAEKFYLFYRPVSYLYFWILYVTCGYNAFLMKIITLMILLTSILLLIGTIKNIAKYYSKNISLLMVFILIIFVAGHPDTIQSVLWISNANEILMILFYLMTLYLISSMIIGNIRPNAIFVVLTTVTFLLSVLSKQQSLHLPLLILLLLTSEKRLKDRQKQILWVLFAIMTLMALFIFVNNITLYLSKNSSDNLLSSLWKKPFALIGILLYIVLPLYGLEIYSYFMLNKEIAIIIVLIIIPYVYVLFKKYNYRKILLYSIILVGIVFIPRIFLAGSDRINVLQIFLFGLSMPIVMNGHYNALKMIVIILAICGILEGWHISRNLSKETAYTAQMDSDLITMIQKQKSDTFIMAYSHPLSTTKNSLYYAKNKTFGSDSTLLYSGIVIRNDLRGFARPKNIKTFVYDDTINIQLTDLYTEINIDRTQEVPSIIDSKDGIRGYSFIKCKLNPKLTKKPFNVIVCSDSGWVNLKL